MTEKGDPDWKITEKITAILEQFITPDSKVEHNVLLPVIGRPDRKPRQCDVVIRFGVKPRQSLAIVEVQKRNKKPDINTFHGWCQKMVEVGAQQLICVSKLGYPNSITNEVKNKYGNTVILMRLEEFDYLKNPEKISVLPFNIILQPSFDFLEMSKMRLTKDLNIRGLNLNTVDKCFSSGDDTVPFAIHEFTSKWLYNNVDVFKLNELKQSQIIIDIHVDKTSKLFFHYGSERILISDWKLKISLNIKRTIQNSIITQYKYRQEFVDGTIAWIASIHGAFNGVERKIEIVFKANREGFVTVRSIVH